MTCYIERRERNSFFPLAVPWPGNEVFGWISSSIEVVGSRIEGYTQDDAVPRPVLFPPGPPPNNEDSSGVIVGASGYGFVPPNQGKSSP
ncbi:hypothetical protein HZU73_09500 [Apis mellifera caucasica]|nr:hypothetical protein HZU73_09500 [Apis mellifera caucasica]